MLLKIPVLDPGDLANYRLIHSLPLTQKPTKKIVANHLCDRLQMNGLFREFE